MPLTAQHIHETLTQLANPERARLCARFFKTDPGEYAEGDVFLGIPVPQIRKIAKEHTNLPLNEIVLLLKSPLHEERRLALTILSERCKKSKCSDFDRKEFYTTYMYNLEYINNWDLVDVSAPHIVGRYLIDKDISMLHTLTSSDNLWKRRIGIISTQYFIKQGVFNPTLELSEKLLSDKHDLIHKAVGWMLRELGQQNPALLRSFLNVHLLIMPRTMLRYAIEKFPEQERKKYLNKKML